MLANLRLATIWVLFFCLLLNPQLAIATTKAPKIDFEFSLPKTITAGEKFDINFNVKNILAGGDLRLKFVAYRADATGKKSYYSCTYNGDACLGNSDKWDSFPKFDRNSKEEINGTITASVEKNDDAGNVTAYLKLQRTTEKSYVTYDSNSQDLWVNPLPPEPAPIDETEGSDETKNVPAPTHYPVVPTDIERKLPATFSAVPAVLGQAVNISSPSASPSASESATAIQQTRPFILLIAGAALVILVTVAGTLWYYKSNGPARN